MPLQPKEFMLYYAAALVLALLLFTRRRPRRGMLLRLRSSFRKAAQAEGASYGNAAESLSGRPSTEKFSHIRPTGERPLNVVFNYNGHSWDAYEVLGLPAGSSPENVEAAYKEGMQKVDIGSRPFLEAAYKAIQAQWELYRASGT
ncbi:MAG: hypothetical protein KF799_15960 [Bdellovibrionales bacterium]|nr:hypothetical protein [Bdellovibrionales bacterium]